MRNIPATAVTEGFGVVAMSQMRIEIIGVLGAFVVRYLATLRISDTGEVPVKRKVLRVSWSALKGRKRHTAPGIVAFAGGQHVPTPTGWIWNTIESWDEQCLDFQRQLTSQNFRECHPDSERAS